MAGTLLGIALAVLAAFFNGTFGVLPKFEAVHKANVSPLHFNAWVSVGLILSSLPLLAVRQVFTPWGMLSGALFVLSTGCTFFAIDILGISFSSAIWSGTAIIASFTWGIRVSGDELQHPGFSVPALLLLVGGLAGIAVNGRYSETIREHKDEADIEDREALNEHRRRLEEERILDPMHQHDEVPKGPRHYGIGCVAAIAAGLFGGLVLAPKTFAPHVRGVTFLPSMALGVLVASPLVTLAVASLTGMRPLPDKQSLKVGAAFGIAAGILWNTGNVLSLLATESVGIAIAYPIFQCGLFVAGVWGIMLFDEIERQAIPAYLLSGVALIAGACFLGLSK